MLDPPRPRFDPAGDPDPHRPDAGHAESGLGAETGHRVEDRLHDSIRPPPRGQPRARDDGAVRGHGDGIRLGSSDIEAESHRPPPIQSGWVVHMVISP